MLSVAELVGLAVPMDRKLPHAVVWPTLASLIAVLASVCPNVKFNTNEDVIDGTHSGILALAYQSFLASVQNTTSRRLAPRGSTLGADWMDIRNYIDKFLRSQEGRFMHKLATYQGVSWNGNEYVVGERPSQRFRLDTRFVGLPFIVL